MKTHKKFESSFIRSYFFVSFIISLIFAQSTQINNKITKNQINESIIEKIESFSVNSPSCTVQYYDKDGVSTECAKGPKNYNFEYKYTAFSAYINAHSYHSNGLSYVTSLFVDDEYHGFGNFMNDGAGMIILIIITGLMILAWVPMIFCWIKRFCIYDDCTNEDSCCRIFWVVITIIFWAACLSFIIVCIVFGE